MEYKSYNDVTAPLVSIVVPIYNMEKFLAETLRSIQQIQYPSLEILLMDDGSSDNSPAIAAEFAAADPRFHVLSQPNQGASAARNNAIRQARGVYILPIDADNLVEPTYVAHAVSAMESDPEVRVVCPRTDQFGLKTGEIHFPPYSIHKLARKNIIDACAMFRRADWERVGGYCPEVPTREDWEFWLSMLEDGGKVVRLPDIEFHYRQHVLSKRHLMRKRTHEVVDIINRRHPELYEREYGGPLRYGRSWSLVINRFYRFFHPRRTVVSPEAPSQVKYFVRSLPIHFSAEHGKLLYRHRNELRMLSYQGRDYVVKQFARPNIINRIVYGFLRKSKAQRSYENALELLRLSIGTPQPVAWQTERNLLLFSRSYYVSLLSPCPYTYADIIAGKLSEEQTDAALSAIAQTTARIHEAGFVHRDYSRGNILFGFLPDGSVEVQLIDLNRLRHHRVVSKEEGCRNFAERLPATLAQRSIMAKIYARLRGFDEGECYRLMLKYNKEDK